MKIFINCRNQKSIHPQMLDSINSQTLKCSVDFIESQSCPTRLSRLKQCKSEFAVFLDEDVVLPRKNFLEDVQKLLSQHPEIHFLSGHYLSDDSAGYFSKAYNWLTNQWMFPQNQGLSRCQNAPGGFWVVRKQIEQLCVNWQEPSDWGGEDTRTIRFLQSRGVEIYTSPDLGVLHYPRSSLTWFLKRAIRQGQAKAQFSLESKINIKSVLINLFRNFYFLPAFLLHQAAVFLGSCLARIQSWTPSANPIIPDEK